LVAEHIYKYTYIYIYIQIYIHIYIYIYSGSVWFGTLKICKHCLCHIKKRIVSILKISYPIAQATCWENKTIKKEHNEKIGWGVGFIQVISAFMAMLMTYFYQLMPADSVLFEAKCRSNLVYRKAQSMNKQHAKQYMH